jgi:membrane protease YdiL (CAAX protease family)
VKKISTFLALTLALSSICWWRVISAGSLGVDGGKWVLFLMWSPGTAALVTRLIYQKNLRGEGWGWGGTRWQLLSYFLPLGYAAVAYSAVWAAGLGGIGAFDRNIVTFILLGSLSSCFSALGEELGWRGFLVPELAKHYNFTRTAVISGLIWAFWHSPLILFADYNAGTSTLYSLACFVVMVVGISFAFAWLRLRSGSVWTGMLLHASHNLWIQGFFDRVTVDTGKTLWYTTEFGAALAVVAVFVAYFFWRRRDQLGPLPAPAP